MARGRPKLLWTAKGLGGGFSSVSLSGGRIYTCGNVEGQSAVTALNLEGETVWRVSVGEAWEALHAARDRRPLSTTAACSWKPRWATSVASAPTGAKKSGG